MRANVGLFLDRPQSYVNVDFVLGSCIMLGTAISSDFSVGLLVCVQVIPQILDL